MDSVSIIIPVFNVAPYIEQCLNSVIGQTYKGMIECILVDDCGTDNSMEIAKRIICDYSGNVHFQLIKHECNKGQSAARNTGIRAATGEYLYFMDSDDWLFPNCLELVLATLSRFPDSQIVFSGMKMTKHTQPFVDFEREKLPDYSDNKEWIKKALVSFKLNVSVWNKLMKKDFVINNNLFMAEGYTYEDDIWCFECAKVLERMSICKHYTYMYRVRENSIMTSVSGGEHKRFLDKIKMIDYKISRIDVECLDVQVKTIWVQLINQIRIIDDANDRKRLNISIKRLSQYSKIPQKIMIRFTALMPRFLLQYRLMNWILAKCTSI